METDIDYRENPHLYKVGRGQQGVLICQPYKSELHPNWNSKQEEAQKSASKIYKMFLQYIDNSEFVGALWLEISTHGFTRSRRYWNHSSGKKWTNDGEWKVLPYDELKKDFMILV